MAFQTPFEIGQSQLLKLRLSSVDTRETEGSLFPFFEEAGAVRFLVIQAAGDAAAGTPAGLWVASEFPLEIRRGKAIYPRPILKYSPLAGLDPQAIAGLHHFDPEGAWLKGTDLPEGLLAALKASNVALRSRGKEAVKDVFFTLDLRRLTGAASRAGLFGQRRLELAGLKTFLRDSAS